MSEEDVTISKLTFRVALYLLRGLIGQKFCNMVIGHALFFFQTLPKELIIKSWSSGEIIEYTIPSLKLLFKKGKASVRNKT